ncbi:MAG: hypothetical protein ACK5OB_20550 [Pirellula sp.]
MNSGKHWYERSLVALAIGLGWSLPMLAQESSPASSSPTNSAPASPNPQGEASLTETHPWLETAPEGLSQLAKLGRVRIGIDDERLRRARKQALTFFRIHAETKYQYKVGDPRLDEEDKDRMKARVRAKVRIPEMHLSHDLYFMSWMQPREPWSDPLVLHEFDHVSISTDPRLRQIILRVLTAPLECWARWPRGERATNESIQEAVNAAMNDRIVELERLVQTQYDALDRQSRDGRETIPDREPFFLQLYGLDSMRNCGFTFIDEMKGMIQEKPSKEVREHYDLLTTP